MSDLSGAIVALLTADESPLRRRVVELYVDKLLDLPIGQLADPGEAYDIVLAALTEDNTQRTVERHIEPGWRRYEAHCEATGDTVGDLVPQDARESIEAIVNGDSHPKMPWMKDAVDPKLVRQLLAPILQETLTNFAANLPIPGLAGGNGGGGGGGGGLLGGLGNRIKKRAEGFAEMGKGVLGGLGAEMERKLNATAREFSQGALTSMRRTAVERLKSAEGRRLTDQIRSQVLERIMETRLSEMNDDLQRLPQDEIWALYGPIVAHNAAREEFRTFLRGEFEAWFAAEGDRTAREVLEEAALLELVRDTLVGRFDGLSQTVFQSDAFTEWAADLLSEAS